MSFPLHKVPRGLLELLAGKTLGQSPTSFSDQVLPVVEVGDFYAGSMLLGTSGAPTVGALAPTLQESLALTTTLGVRGISTALVVGAAAVTNLTLAWGFVVPGGSLFTVGSQFIAQAAAGQVLRSGTAFSRFVLPPGTLLFAEASGTAAGADHSLAVIGMIENYTQQS